MTYYSYFVVSNGIVSNYLRYSLPLTIASVILFASSSIYFSTEVSLRIVLLIWLSNVLIYFFNPFFLINSLLYLTIIGVVNNNVLLADDTIFVHNGTSSVKSISGTLIFIVVGLFMFYNEL